MLVISGACNEAELKSAKDLFSFGRVIGMTPIEAKHAVMFTKEKVK
mgnify:FL=1